MYNLLKKKMIFAIKKTKTSDFYPKGFFSFKIFSKNLFISN